MTSFTPAPRTRWLQDGYASTAFFDRLLASNTKSGLSKKCLSVSNPFVPQTCTQNAETPFVSGLSYLSLEEQSIWASQNHVFPSSERPACPGGRTEDWSAVDARSGSPSEEPSVHTTELDTSTETRHREAAFCTEPPAKSTKCHLRTTSITLWRRKVRLLCRLPKRLMSSGHTLAVGYPYVIHSAKYLMAKQDDHKRGLSPREPFRR